MYIYDSQKIHSIHIQPWQTCLLLCIKCIHINICTHTQILYIFIVSSGGYNANTMKHTAKTNDMMDAELAEQIKYYYINANHDTHQ